MSSPAPSVRILIGEDTPEVAYFIQQTLRYAGYPVEVATDGVACLERARVLRPELLVLDIMMPKMNGVEVLRALRADPATAGMRVIVCTAKDFRTERDEITALGAVDFLIKPFEPAQLIEKVNAYLKRDGVPPVPQESVSAATKASQPYHPQLETGRGCFSLWGTRGSTPTPGGRFLRHGGNTSCMSVYLGEERFIFDAGSGIRELGMELMNGTSRRVNLFVTHTHWDHIQGFPFFTPAYVPGFEIAIYGSASFKKDLKSLFRGQLDHDYFPVEMDDMNACLDFRHLDENPVEIGGAKITWEYAQHPGPTVGYKIDIGGHKIAWVPDNEFLQGFTGDPSRLTRDHPLVIPFAKMIDFLADADVVIHEAQYTDEEYPQKVRWGHSSVSNACLLMKLANVKRWIITHHDPMHDDTFLESKLALTRQILKRMGHDLELSHGYDGLTEYF